MTPDEMSQGMAREDVKRKEERIGENNQSADANAEFSIKIAGMHDIDPMEKNEKQRQIHEIAMNVLQHERELVLTAVGSLAVFPHCAGRRIKEKGAVIDFSAKITGPPKTDGDPDHEKRRRVVPPFGCDSGGIERRQIGAVFVVIALESRPGGIGHEGPQSQEDGQRRRPPSVLAKCGS